MIWDWDLWPGRVAEGAGPLALSTYRIERGMEAWRWSIGSALYPAIRRASRDLSRLLREIA